MPLVPDIILSKPFVLVTISSSPLGMQSQTADYSFGYVERIYDTCDNVSVGQTILFSLKDAKALLYGSTIYYVVDETHRLFKEEPLP